MFDFQNLAVYKKAKLFHANCKKIILRKKLDRFVVDQLGRASFSVPLNIAEGSGKFSKADRKNYLKQQGLLYLNVLQYWIFLRMKVFYQILSLKGC